MYWLCIDVGTLETRVTSVRSETRKVNLECLELSGANCLLGPDDTGFMLDIIKDTTLFFNCDEDICYCVTDDNFRRNAYRAVSKATDTYNEGWGTLPENKSRLRGDQRDLYNGLRGTQADSRRELGLDGIMFASLEAEYVPAANLKICEIEGLPVALSSDEWESFCQDAIENKCECEDPFAVPEEPTTIVVENNVDVDVAVDTTPDDTNEGPVDDNMIIVIAIGAAALVIFCLACLAICAICCRGGGNSKTAAPQQNVTFQIGSVGQTNTQQTANTQHQAPP